MNNKDSDSAWTKSWCCTYGYHDECLGCPRCTYKGHEQGSKHKDVMGGRKASVERQNGVTESPDGAMMRDTAPALRVDQVWNPYDNKWERLG